MEKKILITGANGFIGSSFLHLLDRTDWKIIPLVRQPRGLKNEIVLDFCDSDFSEAVKSLPEVNVIVHLGARIGWDGSSKSLLLQPNVIATGILANWANKIGAYFVFASAAIVCGINTSYINKESKPNPDTDYGYSKWLAEEVIKTSGVKHAILRIAGVFGKNGPIHLGINKTISDALDGIPPVQYGNGKIKRNYIYVKDLVNVIKFCVDNRIEGTHLVAGSSINTVSEMLEVICHVLLSGKKLQHRRGKDGHDQIVEYSATFLKGRSFKEAIEDIKTSTVQQPHKEFVK